MHRWPSRSTAKNYDDARNAIEMSWRILTLKVNARFPLEHVAARCGSIVEIYSGSVSKQNLAKPPKGARNLAKTLDKVGGLEYRARVLIAFVLKRVLHSLASNFGSQAVVTN
jgi:hypothetical protein